MSSKKDIQLIDWLIVVAIFALVIGAWVYLSPSMPPMPKIIGHSSDV